RTRAVPAYRHTAGDDRRIDRQSAEGRIQGDEFGKAAVSASGGVQVGGRRQVNRRAGISRRSVDVAGAVGRVEIEKDRVSCLCHLGIPPWTRKRDGRWEEA